MQTVDPSDATDEFADELLTWLRDRLAHYKCPRSISFEAQLPRTDTGKLYKQELIKQVLVNSDMRWSWLGAWSSRSDPLPMRRLSR